MKQFKNWILLLCFLVYLFVEVSVFYPFKVFVWDPLTSRADKARNINVTVVWDRIDDTTEEKKEGNL
jgi:hypothetical protein